MGPARTGRNRQLRNSQCAAKAQTIRFKAAGRLDTFDWSLYDTRHVLFEPKHMTREQLMDGYVWLFEQKR